MKKDYFLVIGFVAIILTTNYNSAIEGFMGVCFYDINGNPVGGDCINSSSSNNDNMGLDGETSRATYYFESGKPSNCYFGNCLHKGTVHEWTGIPPTRLYVGNFSFNYEGARVNEFFPAELYISPIHGELNFTVNEDFYNGKLRGVSIKDFRHYNLSRQQDKELIECAMNDTLFWDLGYITFSEILKNGKKVNAELTLVSTFDESNSSCYYEHEIIVQEDKLEQRISTLESWKETIQTTITNILQSIALIFTKIDNYTNSSFNSTNPDYFKYLSSSDRQNIVCGYAKDKHLTNYSDLGWNCTVTYRFSGGKEYASCRCKKV